MAKMKAVELVHIYNNIARRKKVALIPLDTKMTLHEVADKIEWANALKDPDDKNYVKPKPQKGKYEPGYYAKKYPTIKLFAKLAHAFS